MELTDGVITLRYPTDADAPALATIVHASLPELVPWMNWATDGYDESSALAWIRDEIDPGSESFLVVDGDGAGEPLGCAGLGPLMDPDLIVELGYWIRTTHTGRGAATRATRLLARHAIEARGARRVELYIAVENEASRRVAAKAGAVHEGVLRDRMRLRGRQHDAHLFSVTAPDVPRLWEP